ncbi:MAG: hypothetical protein Q4D17_04180 [Planctomycetia bacterium]|nr:hypothetical protein [Planctomycetia bacterium]
MKSSLKQYLKQAFFSQTVIIWFTVWSGLLWSSASLTSSANEEIEVPTGKEVVEILNRDDSRGFFRLTGIVESFNRKGLILKTTDGEKTIAAHLVKKVHYRKSEEQKLGELHFQQKNFRDALSHFKKSLAAADRRWIEVEIMEKIIQCETALAFYSQAVTDFLALEELEPEMTDSTFSCIPLAWQAIPGDSQIEGTARKLLSANGKSPTAVLLCGSYLLFSSEGKEIEKRLKLLAENREVRIARLAQAQTWRLELMNLTTEKITQWQTALESFPPEFRGGPDFIVGQAFLRLNDFDPAALAFLKCAWVYGVDPLLTKEALKQAQKALELGGHSDEAQKIKVD